LTPDGEGVDNFIEVGGPLMIAQSLEATRIDGIISIIDFFSEMQSNAQVSWRY
jgi:hypothetical protein